MDKGRKNTATPFAMEEDMPGPPTWPGLAPENLVQHSATEEESQSGSYHSMKMEVYETLKIA